MANQNITRYDLEQAEQPDGAEARMVVHYRGDYVTWEVHEEIVDAMQTELDKAKKVIADALETLREF